MIKLKATLVYTILVTATSLFFAIIFTVNMVYQVTMVGLDPLQLVLVGTTLEAAIFLFEVPTGVVADVYSRRLSIIIGYFLIGAGFILEGSLPVFGAVLMAQVLWGIGYTFTSGATQAWIADEVGEEQAGKVFLAGAQAAQVGGLLGILVSVGLGSIRVNVPIVTAGALFVVLAVFLIVYMPETGFKPKPREERSSWQQMGDTLRSGVRLVSRRPGMLNLLLIGLFFGLYSEGFDRLWTAHILEDITLPTLGNLSPVVWFGVINIVAALLTLGATSLARRFLNPDNPRIAVWTLISNSTLIVAGLVVFALTRSFPVALFTFWTIYITRNLNDPYYTAWLNRNLEPEVRATVFSVSGQVDALGQIAMGPILGAIGSRVSIPAALVSSAVVLSPVLALLVWALPGRDRPELGIEDREEVGGG